MTERREQHGATRDARPEFASSRPCPHPKQHPRVYCFILCLRSSFDSFSRLFLARLCVPADAHSRGSEKDGDQDERARFRVRAPNVLSSGGQACTPPPSRIYRERERQVASTATFADARDTPSSLHVGVQG